GRGVARRPPLRPGARLGDARPRTRLAGAALVVHPHPRTTVEHPGHRRARDAARRRWPLPVVAAPELRGRRGRGCRTAARALGLAHRARLHRGERVAAHRAHPHREPGPGGRGTREALTWWSTSSSPAAGRPVWRPPCTLSPPG